MAVPVVPSRHDENPHSLGAALTHYVGLDVGTISTSVGFLLLLRCGWRGMARRSARSVKASRRNKKCY
jgi:hypothetical protein